MDNLGAVLISIRPEWAWLIAQGLKTLEVRKSRPKLETPFKVYIYQTRQKIPDGFENPAGGRVIGEFTCSQFVEFKPGEHFNVAKVCFDLFDKACLRAEDVWPYSGNGRRVLYGWRITDLQIYKTPLILSALCGLDGQPVTRAPQSWRYVRKVVA